MIQVQVLFQFYCENELVQMHQGRVIQKQIGQAMEVAHTPAEYTVLQYEMKNYLH